MSEPNTERVTCPSCTAAYRWPAAKTGQTVPCKKCGEDFIVPDRPGPGLKIKPEPADDAGLYELADIPDDEPVPPPPSSVVAEPIQQEAPAEPPPPAAPDNDEAEEPVYVSEVKKAARREEQRLAAVANEPAKSWRDYKWLIVILSAVLVLAIIFWTMSAADNAVSDFLGRDKP